MYSKAPKPVTVTEAIKKMEYYCAYQERCHRDVLQKLKTMSLIPEAKEKILLHLLEHNFLNEERFAKSYSRGKFVIKKWGRQRIIRELKNKEISAYNIKNALLEIPEADYMSTFHELAEKKCKSIQESNAFKKRKKLMDYLAYRGWETHLIYEKVQELIP